MSSRDHFSFIENEYEQVKSIGTPSGRNSSSCGYCSPPGQRSKEYSSYHLAGLDATRLTCQVYQKMIDRGWRRSGIWCYKPDLKISCCPQYTIRLDALAFKPSKSQRKLVNRWNRFVLKGREGEMMEVEPNSNKRQMTITPYICRKQKSKEKERAFDLIGSIHTAETSFHSEEHPAHRFEIVLEPSSFTEEKYELFVKYQRDIHHDFKNTPHGFERFLSEDIPYPSSPPPHLPKKYGSYHQLYRLDGELVAMAVLDILPHCVSSVYFMYNKVWEGFSFGKLSTLREVSLAREIHEAGISDMKYLYMGFYIHSCQKMRYKGEYAPSSLLDPESYDWFPLETCKPLLDQNRYACFSKPEESISGDPPAGLLDVKSPRIVDTSILDKIQVLVQVRSPNLAKFLVPIYRTQLWDYDNVREEYEACVEGLGVELIQEVTFEL
ncbi:Arginyl-tRNA--protein transferase 1 [Leucoagaricus sp. SymC.cos]|nr:Arginyl-tRNA--protein transferase 1 [Leucoagaricus sp. SymC.cos]